MTAQEAARRLRRLRQATTPLLRRVEAGKPYTAGLLTDLNEMLEAATLAGRGVSELALEDAIAQDRAEQIAAGTLAADGYTMTELATAGNNRLTATIYGVGVDGT